MERFLKNEDYFQIKTEILNLLDGSAELAGNVKLLRAEQAAIAQVENRLSVRFDCKQIFTPATTGYDNRDKFIVMIVIEKAAQAVFPQGTTIDIRDTAAKGDPYNVFLKQMEYCDAQISKRVLGGTMISDNGSSKAQGNVHENTMAIITERDRKKVEYCINKKVKLVLKIFNDADEFVFDRAQTLSLTERWSIVSGALNKGYQKS